MNTKKLSIILIFIALGSLCVMLFVPKHVNFDTGRISLWKSSSDQDDETEDEEEETKEA